MADLLHPVSWAAGVLDATLRVRMIRRGDVIVGCRVQTARLPESVAERLGQMTGLPVRNRRLIVPNDRQRGFLTTLLPMLDEALGAQAREVIKFRITLLRGGRKRSKALTEFRKIVAEKVDTYAQVR